LIVQFTRARGEFGPHGIYQGGNSCRLHRIARRQQCRCGGSARHALQGGKQARNLRLFFGQGSQLGLAAALQQLDATLYAGGGAFRCLYLNGEIRATRPRFCRFRCLVFGTPG
jgi:hypothetical protein